MTFQAAAKEFEARNIAFGVPQMQTLELLSTDGIYTNLGLLLSEQCTHTMKAAVFEEPTKISSRTGRSLLALSFSR